MNFENEITQKIDLEQNNGLSSFRNFAAQQNHNAFKVFYDFMNEIKPSRILEIGTGLGGLTSFLKEAASTLGLDLSLRSYDIYEMNWYDDLRSKGIDIRVKNIFKDDYSSVEEEVVSFISQEGVCVVLCDGGNKVGEFRILSDYIKKGDFILAHDYVDTRENFTENYMGKIWNWHEICQENIQEACTSNNLEKFYEEEFNSVVWTCRKKM